MSNINQNELDNFSFYYIIIKILQVIPSIICNAVMISYFVKSLQILGAGTATALNS